MISHSKIQLEKCKDKLTPYPQCELWRPNQPAESNITKLQFRKLESNKTREIKALK